MMNRSNRNESVHGNPTSQHCKTQIRHYGHFFTAMITVITFSISLPLSAQTGNGGFGTPGATSTSNEGASSSSRSATTGQALSASPTIVAPPTSTEDSYRPPNNSNINDSAKKSSGANASGIIANIISAAGMFATAVAVAAATPPSPQPPCSPPPSMIMCVMSGMSLMQAMANGAAKSGADNVGALTQPDGNLYGANAPQAKLLGLTSGNNGDPNMNSGDASGLTTSQREKISSLMGKLAQSGVKFSSDGKSVTLPNGKTVPTSSFSSPGGMAGLGFSGSDISQALAAVEKVKEDPRLKTAMDLSAGEAGGGAVGADRKPAAGEEGFDMNKFLAGMSGDKRDKPSVSGLTRRFGNEVIGVSADDIFNMVSRQYQRRDQLDSFYRD